MGTKDIRILSVRQPFADQIIFGDKWNELRSWSTPYRGEFFIHASRWEGSKFQETPGEGVVGAIIGRVVLLDCREEDDVWAVRSHLLQKKPLPKGLEELASLIQTRPSSGWDHGVGEWNWILGDARPLKTPIPMLGKLNLWHATVDEGDLVFRNHRNPLTTRPERKTAKSKTGKPPKKVRPKKLYIPSGSSARHLYYYLKRQREQTANLTLGVLQSFAYKLNTSVSDLQAALANHPVFEKVSEDSSLDNIWRVHVVEEKT